MKNVMLIVTVLVTLIGCSHSEYNAMVAADAIQAQQAFGKALAIQTTEGGRTAVTLTYALGVGRPQYQRDDTVLDYANAFLPYANLFTQLYMYGGFGGNGAGSGNSFNVDGNSHLQVNIDSLNTATAYGQSFNTAHENSYNDIPTSSYNTQPSDSYNPSEYHVTEGNY